MKKRMIKYIYGLLLLGFATSCMEDEEVKLPDGPGNIQAEAGYGEVVFSWDFPQDPNVVFVKVTYQNSAGENKHQKFSQYAETAVIAGLEERAYDFEISLGDKNGNLSDSKMVSVTPNKPPYLFVAETVELIPDFGSVKVLWENVTEREVAINVKYTDVNGQPKTEVFNSSDVQGQGEITDVAAVEQTFEVYVANPTGLLSDSEMISVAPYAEEKLDKANWEVIDISAEEQEGQKFNLYDDDISTFWHSPWSWSQPNYPHYFIIDLKEEKVISRIGLVNRQNDSRGMTKVSFSGSTDNENWTELGEFDFEQINDEQKFRLVSNPTLRYIKVTALEGSNFFTFLAEVYLYGQ
ncbi:DUF5126 domain-containing protein [Echinicola sp. CAU 1574]|uniref:DUF5126 domain-containing protein n=1 Tax=Echinicola arenosa TaxID=2774144 RepID=A0ABR9AG29_9BACT|nr:DUF5126 domain-containing protein [Echinicola arenosa]MBD8487814.1 DUF5126 domain-containing protein [Echinicola arenosa]